MSYSNGNVLALCEFPSTSMASGFTLILQFNDPANVELHDRRKKFKVYHVNMLQKWHVPIATAGYSEELSEDHEDIPTWEEINPVGVGNVKLGEK